MTRKPKSTIERGPTSERVSRNVRRYREDARLTLAGLSRRMAVVGRPMDTPQLAKIEGGQRRVDVDDLMALAEALDAPVDEMLLVDDACLPAEIAGNWRSLAARWERRVAEGP